MQWALCCAACCAVTLRGGRSISYSLRVQICYPHGLERRQTESQRAVASSVPGGTANMAQKDPYYIVKDEVVETVRTTCCFCYRHCCRHPPGAVGFQYSYGHLPAVCSCEACKISSADGRACRAAVRTSGSWRQRWVLCTTRRCMQGQLTARAAAFCCAVRAPLTHCS